MSCATISLAPVAARCATKQRRSHTAVQPCNFRRSAAAPCKGLRVGKQAGNRPARGAVVSVSALYGAEWNTPKDAYLTLGLAHCFEKTDDGKLADRFLIEPITANSLECMSNGGKTCFKYVFSLPLEDAMQRSKALLPAEFADGMFCEDYEARCDSSARTWMRPHALDNLLDIVPLGQLNSNFNYSTDDKRVLNFENVVNDDDNIKQDISIDVYGRKEKQEAEAEVTEAQQQEEDDDVDALLMA